MIYDGNTYRELNKEEEKFLQLEKQQQEVYDSLYPQKNNSEQRITQLEKELTAFKILTGEKQ